MGGGGLGAGGGGVPNNDPEGLFKGIPVQSGIIQRRMMQKQMETDKDFAKAMSAASDELRKEVLVRRETRKWVPGGQSAYPNRMQARTPRRGSGWCCNAPWASAPCAWGLVHRTEQHQALWCSVGCPSPGQPRTQTAPGSQISAQRRPSRPSLTTRHTRPTGLHVRACMQDAREP